MSLNDFPVQVSIRCFEEINLFCVLKPLEYFSILLANPLIYVVLFVFGLVVVVYRGTTVTNCSGCISDVA
jgi:hypothetical protein